MTTLRFMIRIRTMVLLWEHQYEEGIVQRKGGDGGNTSKLCERHNRASKESSVGRSNGGMKEELAILGKVNAG